MASKPMRNALTEGSTARSWLIGKPRQQQQRATASADPESSDSASGGEEDVSTHEEKGDSSALSDNETRRFSVSVGDDTTKMEAIKSGYLQQHTRGFTRWSKRYCMVQGPKLFIRKNPTDTLREEILLKDANIAENSTKNVNHSFTIMTPQQSVVMAGSSRKDMDDWIVALRSAAAESSHLIDQDGGNHLTGHHTWFSCSHPRKTFCNVCREPLHGMAWHGLSCEVCKLKTHRRCVFNVEQSCKWASRSNLLKDGAPMSLDFSFPHQWLEGNLPAGSKCLVCRKTCGSVKRLQDFRCLWCKSTVHTECRDSMSKMCDLGPHCLSTLPPSAVQLSDAIQKGWFEPYKVPNHNPVLALVNSKSGDNQGVTFLRRLKYWLNPVQVFDLAISGPELGLRLFHRLDRFRVIVFGGDGSIGWVLSTIDKLHLHSKCMVGVVPLGTGNDLARVLGWGSQCNDGEKIPSILTDMEHSTFKLLDRWSVQFSPDQSLDVSHLLTPDPVGGTHHQRTHSSASKSSAHDTSSRNTSPSPLGISPSPRNNSPSPRIPVTPKSNTPSPEPSSLSTTPETSVGKKDSDSGSQLRKLLQGLDPHQDQQSFLDSIMAHISSILVSQEEATVISSAQLLCEVVKKFLESLLEQQKQTLPEDELETDPLVQKCTLLDDKLKGLLATLKLEANSVTDPQQTSGKEKVFRPREALMARANSLKKAVQNVIDLTEKAVDEQEETTAEVDAITRSALSNIEETTEQNRPRQPNLLSLPRRQPSGSSLVSNGGSPVSITSHLPELKELTCMNNYLGIGMDAKIAYEFHNRREERLTQYMARARNKMLYGYLGGRELFSNSQRYLERRIVVECDGTVIELPQKLQGLVFLNIPSYMAGTNFWGTEKETGQFSAPSLDDKLFEVVGITGFIHLATSKILGIQNHRLVQCRCAKITILSQTALQVDGEAWMQEPGCIVVTHKNKARLMFKDKAFTQSLESWHQKQSTGAAPLPTPLPPFSTSVTTLLSNALTDEEVEAYQELATFSKLLVSCIQAEAQINPDVVRGLIPHVNIMNSYLDRLFPGAEASETADLEHLQDFESSVKSLVQETLWYLNMNKIREDETMRELVQGVESCMRKVILADHSTATLARRGMARRSSDSALLTHSSSRVRQLEDSPHRTRATQMGHSESRTQIAEAARKIGKAVSEWSTEDVCEWLKEIGMEEYRDNVRSHDVGGADLLTMKTSDISAIGITKVGVQARLRQAIQVLSSPSSSPAISRSSQSNN